MLNNILVCHNILKYLIWASEQRQVIRYQQNYNKELEEIESFVVSNRTITYQIFIYHFQINFNLFKFKCNLFQINGTTNEFISSWVAIEMK